MESGNHRSSHSCPRGITLWVLACVFLACAGWILSALHQLNAVGYGAAILLGIALGIGWWKTCAGDRASRISGFNLKKFQRRFGRLFPGAFLAVAIMAFIGGAIHPPSNYDALAYRVPRVLHWLAAGQWHWIHTGFQRLNVRATGIEWISAPLIVFFKTDRLFFLINIISFLLLPGLVFSAFTRLGVKPRVAWYWMWLVPTGYCFLLQAGSIGNDLFGAVFALAALDYALRAKTSRRINDVWLACLAGALLTGGKTSNFPLLLPICVALLPSVGLLKKHFAATVGVGLVAALASFLPVAVLNVKNCGDWSGQAAEQARFMQGAPVLHVTQNALLLVEQNLAPPVFPMASQWNRAVQKIVPTGRMKALEANFEPGGAHLSLGEMQLEEDAGLGFGVSLLLLLTFLATFFAKPHAGQARRSQLDCFQIGIFGAALISLVPYLWVSGSTTAARLLTPYYCLIIPFFLLWQTGDWTRRRAWWRWAASLVFILAILLLIISPARPLWPANSVLSRFNKGGNALLKRAATVYSIYGQRADSFAPAREQLPDAPVIGLVTFDDPETSLWRPFGHRRIEHVLAGDNAAELNRRGIEYVLVSTEYLADQKQQTLDQWLGEHGAEVVKMIPLTLRASKGPVDWALVRIKPAGTKGL